MHSIRVLQVAAVTALAVALSACVTYTAPPRAYPASYPAAQYPAQQYPAQQYPAQQYPAQQYPAQQYPAQQYPAQQYPAQNYPAAAAAYPAAQAPAPALGQQGRVLNVEALQVQQPSANNGVGAGAVVGGLVGGVLGNQVGKGNGRTVATLAGVVGGAMAGNAMEKANNPAVVNNVYRVTVQLDSGTVRSFDYPTAPGLRVGDRVRVENNQLYR